MPLYRDGEILGSFTMPKKVSDLKPHTDTLTAHYDSFNMDVSKISNLRLDPYAVAKQWRLGAKDDSGVLFHCLKTIARFGEKNSKEREIKALYASIKRLAELEGVDLG